MGDLPIKEELQDKNPVSGETKSEKKTDKTPLKEEDMTDREKEILKEKQKAQTGKIAVNLGNAELIQIKLLEQTAISNNAILKQLKEINYYLSILAEKKIEKPDFMKVSEEKKDG